ncbi:hypothetical protein RND71_017787 [Anisodus tanguticus]|uniref:Uncharacterized protein n=1 Tax=Anisodus tanguticus TaxID=243964 RepID=A0AAE1VGB8_9SOLA|nr:hypothetical protein RND71_017787 [Anisodus tanguticus]
MPSSISLQHNVSAIAYGFRYPAHGSCKYLNGIDAFKRILKTDGPMLHPMSFGGHLTRSLNDSFGMGMDVTSARLVQPWLGLAYSVTQRLVWILQQDWGSHDWRR